MTDRVASSSGTGHDAALFTQTPPCECCGTIPCQRPADLPVAAPDPEAMRLRAESQCSHFHAGSGVGDTWCDRCGKPLNRWDEKCDYQLDAAHLLAEDVLALLVERQQDKERIERLETAMESIGRFASAHGGECGQPVLLSAVYRIAEEAEAALAVEEDAPQQILPHVPSLEPDPDIELTSGGPPVRRRARPGKRKSLAVEEDAAND